MRDSFGREIHYLRVSLTDRCNLRCVYCMPARGANFQPHECLLTDAELVRVIRLATQLGIDRVRLTGGEPTVRPHFLALVETIAHLPGIRDVAITTNGILLEKLADPLARAGVRRVNVSLDTLKAERFKQMTRGGKFEAVWHGIRAAERAGLLPIKLNSVVVRGYNDDELTDLAGLTLDNAWDIRFIEMMPIGANADFQTDSFVPVSEMRQRIQSAFGTLEPMAWDGRTPARPYRLRGGKGTLGFISSVSEPFCTGCDRLRLTSDGKLRLCLLRDLEVDLLTLLRAGANDAQLLDAMRGGIWNKPWGHLLDQQTHPTARLISQIGG